MTNRIKTSGKISMACGAAALLALTGCGGDSLPSGPMDEDELSDVFLTGRDVPSDWDIEVGPNTFDSYGDNALEFLRSLGISGVINDDSGECNDDLEEWQDEFEDLELNANGNVGYSSNDTAYMMVVGFSTRDDTDIVDDFFDRVLDCGMDDLEDEGFEVVTSAASLNGFTAYQDSGDETGIVIAGGQSYDQNHLLVIGGSSDPRDEDLVDDLVELVHERFEDGPGGDD